jgi:hypothetical protein
MKGRLLALALVGGAAHAHQGATVSKALFTSPPAPTAITSDAGGLTLAPYTFATADAQFTVSWNVDLPTDPTGRFSFYYLDHMPPSAVTYDQIVTLATPIPEASDNNTYWVSCFCSPDAGVVCPDAGRTHCSETQFVWNTSALPAGSYWLIAANFDYPYKIYTVSPGPVRVAHGGATPPPAAVVVLPDGLFATDKSYTTVWLATGTPPLHFDVFYGINIDTNVLDPTTPLGQNITPIQNSDGSFSYLWDTSALPNGFYYFGVKITDGNGQSTFTDSQLGENVYHPPADGGLIFAMPDLTTVTPPAPDLAKKVLPPPDAGGCSCDIGASSTVPLMAGLLAALFLVLALRARRS